MNLMSACAHDFVWCGMTAVGSANGWDGCIHRYDMQYVSIVTGSIFCPLFFVSFLCRACESAHVSPCFRLLYCCVCMSYIAVHDFVGRE